MPTEHNQAVKLLKKLIECRGEFRRCRKREKPRCHHWAEDQEKSIPGTALPIFPQKTGKIKGDMMKKKHFSEKNIIKALAFLLLWNEESDVPVAEKVQRR